MQRDKNNIDNPPHYKAKAQYVNKVTDQNFLNTAIAIKIGETPQPIIFEITQQGPMIPKKSESNTTSTGTGILGAINKPTSYGNQKL